MILEATDLRALIAFAVTIFVIFCIGMLIYLLYYKHEVSTDKEIGSDYCLTYFTNFDLFTMFTQGKSVFVWQFLIGLIILPLNILSYLLILVVKIFSFKLYNPSQSKDFNQK